MKENAPANDGDSQGEQDRAQRQQDPETVSATERRAQAADGGAAEGEPQGDAAQDQSGDEPQQIANDDRRPWSWPACRRSVHRDSLSSLAIFRYPDPASNRRDDPRQ